MSERKLQMISVTSVDSCRIFSSVMEKKNPELKSPSIQEKHLERPSTMNYLAIGLPRNIFFH